MNTKNLLVELCVEELPPKALKRLGESFAAVLADSLKSQGLTQEAAVVTSYASPRRLAVHISHVAQKAADKAVSQKLMPVSVGLAPDGSASPALLKKLAALGADASVVPQLKREMDGKAEALFYDNVQSGVSLQEGLQKALEDSLAKLPIPKVMSYPLQDGWNTVNFVRPAHKLVALHGADIIAVSTLGLHAGRETLGHRFEANCHPVVLKDADHYAEQMEQDGSVIASFADRRAEISLQLKAAAEQVAKDVGSTVTPIEDDALLDEVTALVERPNVLIGQFEESFLEVPQECLILTMKANQKYFPLLNDKGQLTNKFLIVSNIRPADASAVIGGNERVVRPRLADAKFFFDQDRKKTLASRVEGLAKVVYHNKLGTQGARIERVRSIARAIAEQLGEANLVAQADMAAQLAKADLLTDMVGEFPELQGTMGGYYALHDGLGEEIAHAIEDHYKPRFSGDTLPRNTTGIVVALADKLETLAGLFAIGQIPTGDKDPFALRRHALGVLRILMDAQLPLQLPDLVDLAFKAFPEVIISDKLAPAQLSDFIYERLRNYLRDAGATPEWVDAVLSLRPARIDRTQGKLAAVAEFVKLPEAQALAAANKRIVNILKKSPPPEGEFQLSYLNAEAEKALVHWLTDKAPAARQLFEAGDYTGALKSIASLREPVDTFFDQVMVMDEDLNVRNNRLALLSSLAKVMNAVADLSKLSV